MRCICYLLFSTTKTLDSGHFSQMVSINNLQSQEEPYISQRKAEKISPKTTCLKAFIEIRLTRSQKRNIKRTCQRWWRNSANRNSKCLDNKITDFKLWPFCYRQDSISEGQEIHEQECRTPTRTTLSFYLRMKRSYCPVLKLIFRSLIVTVRRDWRSLMNLSKTRTIFYLIT
jgi:hypothetical protein